MKRQFETHQPIDLVVEIGKGRVRIFATTPPRPPARGRGPDADEVDGHLRGERPAPGDRAQAQQRLLRPGPRPRRRASPCRPTATLAVKTGSADIEVDGQVARRTRSRPGSGDVTLRHLLRRRARSTPAPATSRSPRPTPSSGSRAARATCRSAPCLKELQRLHRLRRRRGRHHQRPHRRQDRLRRPARSPRPTPTCRCRPAAAT